jgi:hypothetical protein
MHRSGTLLLTALAGCAAPVPPEALERVDLVVPPASPGLHVRVTLDLESSWLTGRFDGVVVAATGPRPAVRAQFFPDLGGKALDLLARPDRIIGHLPLSAEGVDTALPGAPAHPLVLMGVTLLEHFAPLTRDRVRAARAAPEGWWLRLDGVARGAILEALLTPEGTLPRRRFSAAGVRWEEEIDARGSTIRAEGMCLRVDVLETATLKGADEETFRLTLPPDVRGPR